MNNQIQVQSTTAAMLKKHALMFVQFFLIIFVYHLLKDLKDTVVITGAHAGAEVIPFIKIWAILPCTVGLSYAFSKVYQRWGREKTLYLFVSCLLLAYLTFAFLLYPYSETLHLTTLSEYLTMTLPQGCRGFIAMVGFWHYTLFYLSAEFWSLIILTILFWGFINARTSFKDASGIYPLFTLVGNIAGIVAGQSSYGICHHMTQFLTWGQMVQIIVMIVCICGIGIMVINRVLTLKFPVEREEIKSKSFSFIDNLKSVLQSLPLLCVAILVIGFGLTSNLVEVLWKDALRHLHPLPQDYNAYINYLSSLIGTLSVIMAFFSQFLFKRFSWVTMALATPIALLVTISIFFVAQVSTNSSLEIVVALGSIYYVTALVAKYTLFDTTKEMAYIAISPDDSMKAKSIIDSIGSRLGKSGASCLYQFLLIVFGSATGYIGVIGVLSLVVVGGSILAVFKLKGERAISSHSF